MYESNEITPINSSSQFIQQPFLKSTEPTLKNKVLGRRALERLDLLLLVIEALDLNGSQGMLWTSNKIGLSTLFPNQVEIWKRRCHNPLRKATRRGTLSSTETNALILLICTMSERLYPNLRQLISSNEPEIENKKRWDVFIERLKDLIEERLNRRRGAVQKLLELKSSDLAVRRLILTLAFCVGPSAVERLQISLLDTNF
ncbi:DUF3038 domain-containing protein [Prochlorococcus sp. MIT 1307]|uniref:DUF3038 domain-containing protein n=1 Tax=Prochlorococcus sp. MIT 1307 TaxID=3096219 RepID=UPI002A7615A4|nr:DUF3038 domain-containing protein [Prochlorococcus sp. MIT 1307]